MSEPRILLVEDYEGFADSVVRALGAYGFPVAQVAGTLHEAIDAIDDGAWDAVVTDWDLGNGHGGQEVAMAALNYNTPLVVLWSTVSRAGEVDPGLEAEARFHLLEKSEMAPLMDLLNEIKEEL
jgi:DNA-binding response OmpR family regulator